MASVGLLRRNPHPSDDEIRDALGSNICRCTGYVKIIEAVKYAAALGRGRRRAVNEIVPAHNIGDYVPMVDGPEKVSGRAKYTADLAVEPGTLAGRIYRSPYAHAEIIEVDVSEALKLPGVKAIVTGAECDKTFGVLPIARSEHPLARDKVRYRGEPVAAVAAVDDATAKAALALIKMKVRELPAYFTAAEAMAPDAVHCTRRSPAISNATCSSSWAMSSRPSPTPTSCARHLQLRRGLPEPDGDARRGRRYDAERDRMTVHASTQVPYYVHLMLSQILGMDMSQIRVVKPHVGGGFGCRTETLNVELIAALLGAQGQRQRAARDQPRGDLHHPSRAAGDRHPAQDRAEEGRPHHRRRMRMHPARRRAFRLRRGDDPLFRLDALRDLRPEERQIYRQARAHQHAAVRRVPRPRHGRRALRLREPARPDGGRDSGSIRSRCGARTICRCRAADLHRQRPDGGELRPARMHRLGRARERLARSARASCANGAQGQSAKALASPARTTSPARRSR